MDGMCEDMVWTLQKTNWNLQCHPKQSCALSTLTSVNLGRSNSALDGTIRGGGRPV